MTSTPTRLTSTSECRNTKRRMRFSCPNHPVAVDASAILQSGLLGEFRRLHGWDEWAEDPRFTNEHWQMEQVFLRARDLSRAERA